MLPITHTKKPWFEDHFFKWLYLFILLFYSFVTSICLLIAFVSCPSSQRTLSFLQRAQVHLVMQVRTFRWATPAIFTCYMVISHVHTLKHKCVFLNWLISGLRRNVSNSSKQTQTRRPGALRPSESHQLQLTLTIDSCHANSVYEEPSSKALAPTCARHGRWALLLLRFLAPGLLETPSSFSVNESLNEPPLLPRQIKHCLSLLPSSRENKTPIKYAWIPFFCSAKGNAFK